MGILGQDYKLPGSIIDIQSEYDNGYDSSEFGTTQSVVVIGTAFDGPIGTQVAVYTPEHAKYIFGETYKDRKEATLVAEIENAYKAGCRSIYAFRIGGQDIYKDFELAADTNLKLRVRGAFASNKNKDVYMLISKKAGEYIVSIYKPASRSTMDEKQMAIIDGEDSILMNRIDLSSLNITKDSPITDAINAINTNIHNNVINLSLVDENGDEMTLDSSSKELSVGALFQGIYLIGREQCDDTPKDTTVEYVFGDGDASTLPYARAKNTVYKKLIMNTDITAPYPIYGSAVELSSKLNININASFDFLKIPNSLDTVYKKNNVDYDGTDMDSFELYKALGSGFATTACIVKKGESGGYKVIETPEENSNRTVEIKNGYYSILENFKADYRVLTCANADDKITSKIPRKKDFEIAVPAAYTITGKTKKLIRATSIFNNKDMEAKVFDFEINMTKDDSEFVLNKNDILFGKVFKINPETKTGLYAKLDAGKLKLMKADAPATSTDIESKKYVLIETLNSVSVFAFGVDGALTPYGQVSDAIGHGENEYSAVVYSAGIESTSELAGVERIKVFVNTHQFYDTLEEFVDELNSCQELKNILNFSLIEESLELKDDAISELFENYVSIVGTTVDRVKSYDTNLYIPYKTKDNFARQLAQHCAYTSLKTAQTHGIMGVKIINNTSIEQLSNKVDELLKTDYELYVKKANGNVLLNSDLMPYHIGHNISIVVNKNIIPTISNYSYISNCAAYYGGYISTLPLNQSSTNQKTNLISIGYNFTATQLSMLSGKGYVTFKYNKQNIPSITDGLVMGQQGTQFARLSYIKINNAVGELIRIAVEPFIGKPNNLVNRAAIDTAIKSQLEPLVGNVLQVFDFIISCTKTSNINAIDIDYVIIPFDEIVQIRNGIKVKKSKNQ